MGSRLENAWAVRDERLEGLLVIANAINTAVDLATSEASIVQDSEFSPDEYPVWTPLRLAQRMRDAAERIERSTEQ